jgi:myo-inositol-1(or 4)-monophosphatase
LRVAARKQLKDALFATGIPFLGRGDHDRFGRELAGVMGVSSGVRRFGAAALDLAYVAAGRFDGFWERGLSPWDMAAGILLVREAGGVVTDINGGNTMLETGTIVCSNEPLHPQLLKLLKSA